MFDQYKVYRYTVALKGGIGDPSNPPIIHSYRGRCIYEMDGKGPIPRGRPRCISRGLPVGRWSPAPFRSVWAKFRALAFQWPRRWVHRASSAIEEAAALLVAAVLVAAGAGRRRRCGGVRSRGGAGSLRREQELVIPHGVLHLLTI